MKLGIINSAFDQAGVDTKAGLEHIARIGFDSVDICTSAPETGIYRMLEDGRVVYDRFDYHRRAVESENEAFFLRILGPGDYRYEGADIGILVTRGRSMTKNFQLNDRAKKWIHGIKQSVAAKPLPVAEAGPALADPAFKIL